MAARLEGLLVVVVVRVEGGGLILGEGDEDADDGAGVAMNEIVDVSGHGAVLLDWGPAEKGSSFGAVGADGGIVEGADYGGSLIVQRSCS